MSSTEKRRLRLAARVVANWLALMPLPVLAQAYQCRIPEHVAPLALPAPDGPSRRAPVARYTLAASWSPDWCKMHGDTTSMQCSRRNGRFGFVLHGLWPEAAHGPAPQWCAARYRPSAALIRRNMCRTPSASLLVHEWAKHGTCMTATPSAYFKTAGILWDAVTWPDADRLSRKEDLVAGDLRDAFLAANPGWPRGAVGIDLSRGGWLREVRLCYGRDFRPRACAARQLGARDGVAMKIWRGL